MSYSIKRKLMLVLKLILIIASILAAIKTLLIGLDVDEEYAITMAYRIASGDFMFTQMWEPHQTSGFLCAVFIKIFMTLTGGTTYLVLFLRMVGTVIQVCISIFLYCSIKRWFNKDLVFLIAVFFFNTLPKWIQTPEFSNMQIWFAILMLLCILQYFGAKKQQPIWLVLAAICSGFMVLSYPSTALVALIYVYGIWRIGHKEYGNKKAWQMTAIFGGSMVTMGVLYILFFLRRMTPNEFVQGMKEMMTDGAHTASYMEKIIGYLQQILELMGYTIGVVLFALILSLLILRKQWKEQKERRFFLVSIFSIIGSIILQIIMWLAFNFEFSYPNIFYYIVAIVGLIAYIKMHRKNKDNLDADNENINKAVIHDCLLYYGTIAGIISVISCLLLTNSTVGSMGAHMMSAIIAGILFLDAYCHDNISNLSDNVIWISGIVLLCICMIFAKGYLLRGTGGVKYDIHMVRQKALSGPSKGIYYMYMTGYGYNYYADIVNAYVGDENILYVGSNNIRYLLTSGKISTFSTISTPAFDARLEEYWQQNPDRYPEVVIVDDITYLDDIKKIIELPEPIVDSEGMLVYRLVAK